MDWNDKKNKFNCCKNPILIDDVVLNEIAESKNTSFGKKRF